MEIFIAIIGFLGGWFLVAGPIYQASLELQEQDVQIDRIRAAGTKITVKRKVSIWWWLLPPVKIYLQSRRNNEYNKEFLKALHPADIQPLLRFINKATGWLLVAAGASLIAFKETYELFELIKAPQYLFWIVLVVMLYICILYTIVRDRRTKGIIGSIEK